MNNLLANQKIFFGIVFSEKNTKKYDHKTTFFQNLLG